MAAANPAETPARRGVNTGVGSGGGLIPVLEWDDIKAKSRRILRRSTNRARCWERMKKRAKDLLHGSPGEIVSDLEGEVTTHGCNGKNMRIPVESREINGENSFLSLKWKILLRSISMEENSTDPGGGELFPLRDGKGKLGIKGSVHIYIIRGKGEIRASFLWKLPIQDLLFLVKCINSVPAISTLGERNSYFSSRSLCFGNPTRIKEKSLLPIPLCLSPAVQFWACRGNMEKKGEAEKEMNTMAARREPAVPSGDGSTPHNNEGAVERRPRGGCSPLIIDMEAARRAISGSLVVGCFLSPFQVNPQILVNELRAISAWKLQGGVTVQEVASVDGRFVLNFSIEEDRKFVLKAQPWHYKLDGIIFAEFDDKGDPAEIDLGAMPIWAQVRDLPFEIKTESVGRSLGGQIGEVIAVSHRNHMIVEKFLRIRVKIPLHEPLKHRVEFTPLGSDESIQFDVRYEKLPLYCECCGLVGHTSERFCRIPKEIRVASFPKNLSVDAYWKGQLASKRAIMFNGPNSNIMPGLQRE